jgi:hypothetical protein
MYKIAIPSYNRIDQLLNKTLTLLDKENIDFSIITVFVANQEQYKLYREALDNFKNGLGKKIKVVKGIKGIVEINNFINRYYKPNDIVFYIHDDIDKFIYYDKSVKDALEKCAEYLKKSTYGLMSFNPTGNEFYMRGDDESSKKFKEGFYYAVGPMFMFKPNPKILRSKDTWAVEDYDYSIKSYKLYGKNIRYDRFSCKTKINNNKDGGVGIRDYKTYLTSLMNLYNKNKDYINLVEKTNKSYLKTYGVETIKHPRLVDKTKRSMNKTKNKKITNNRTKRKH